MSSKRTPRIARNFQAKKIEIKGIDIIILFVIIAMIIFAIRIILWNVSNERNESLIKEIQEKEIAEVIVEVDGEEIKTIENDFSEMNENVKAWIKVNNTSINYPIVQSTNNEYYLKHNLAGKWSNAGWIFADYRNDLQNLDKNTIIYGHNMKNDTMFAELEKMLNNEFYSNENINIIFNTVDYKYIAEIISVYEIEASEFVVRNQFTDKEFEEYIKEIKNKSLVEFDTEVNNDDKILTLYTCDDSNKNRIIVQAKLTLIKKS